MSFGSQDGRSRPWVGEFGGDLCGNKWGMKINESAEDTVVLLSQFSDIGFRISNQVRIFDISLESFHIDGLQLLVCDSLRYSMTMVWRLPWRHRAYRKEVEQAELKSRRLLEITPKYV